MQIGVLQITCDKGRMKKTNEVGSPTKSKCKEKEVELALPKRSRGIKCFKCLGHRHIASKCPNKRVMVLREAQWEPESEDEACEEKEGQVESDKEEEIKYADVGETLVVRRTLSVHATK